MTALEGDTALATSSGERLHRLGVGMLDQSLPLAVFLLVLVPRLADLAGRPFWCDEVRTAERIAMPLPKLIGASFLITCRQPHHNVAL